jgi:hypothetical protein
MLRAEDGELLQRPLLPGLGERPAVALANADPLERQGPLAQLRQRRHDPLAGADRNDHHRDLSIAGEEPRAAPDAVDCAVDAEEHGRARDTVAAQRLADRDGGLAATHVDGELHLPGDVGRSGARTFEGDETVALKRVHVVEQSLDALGHIDCDRHERQVLRQRQDGIRAQVMLGAEPFDPAQQHARLHGMPAIDVEQRIGEEAIARALALAEVGRQLEQVGHR